MKFTIFNKHDGPMTKRIRVVDGALVKDNDLCGMSTGTAVVCEIGLISDLSLVLNGMKQSQALCAGIPRSAENIVNGNTMEGVRFLEEFRVVTKRMLSHNPDAIARDKKH